MVAATAVHSVMFLALKDVSSISTKGRKGRGGEGRGA
jgi:hypothetical protein